MCVCVLCVCVGIYSVCVCPHASDVYFFLLPDTGRKTQAGGGKEPDTRDTLISTRGAGSCVCVCALVCVCVCACMFIYVDI